MVKENTQSKRKSKFGCDLVAPRATDNPQAPCIHSSRTFCQLFSFCQLFLGEEVALPHWFFSKRSWACWKSGHGKSIGGIFDTPCCLFAWKKLRTHQKWHLVPIQVVKEERPLTEDTHRDARHSWISPPALAVTKIRRKLHSRTLGWAN